MGYVVTRPGEFTDAEFWEYVRLLRQRGIDIGRLPRVLDPQTGKRWLYVWTDREAAKDFADELNQGVPDAPWEVTETDAPPSIGPVGPIIIQMVRRSDGVVFGLHTLSRAILRSVFPAAVGITSYPSIDLAVWADAAKRSGGRQGLVERILPNLTGLSGYQLEAVGYSVIDVDSEQTVLTVAPAVARPFRFEAAVARLRPCRLPGRSPFSGTDTLHGLSSADRTPCTSAVGFPKR